MECACLFELSRAGSGFGLGSLRGQVLCKAVELLTEIGTGHRTTPAECFMRKHCLVAMHCCILKHCLIPKYRFIPTYRVIA